MKFSCKEYYNQLKWLFFKGKNYYDCQITNYVWHYIPLILISDGISIGECMGFNIAFTEIGRF